MDDKPFKFLSYNKDYSHMFTSNILPSALHGKNGVLVSMTFGKAITFPPLHFFHKTSWFFQTRTSFLYRIYFAHKVTPSVMVQGLKV